MTGAFHKVSSLNLDYIEPIYKPVANAVLETNCHAVCVWSESKGESYPRLVSSTFN